MKNGHIQSLELFLFVEIQKWACYPGGGSCFPCSSATWQRLGSFGFPFCFPKEFLTRVEKLNKTSTGDMHVDMDVFSVLRCSSAETLSPYPALFVEGEKYFGR